MVRKPARMYRDIKGRAYTRREYMGGIPGSRITQFDLGYIKGEFPITVSLQSVEACQIRHNALEAARIAANKYIQKKAGNLGYHLKIKVFPHQVLRENKQATGAGADRVSEGMRRAFGKAVGTAARIQANQNIISIRVDKQNFKHAKDALRRASMKLPTSCRIVIERGTELVS